MPLGHAQGNPTGLNNQGQHPSLLSPNALLLLLLLLYTSLLRPSRATEDKEAYKWIRAASKVAEKVEEGRGHTWGRRGKIQH